MVEAGRAIPENVGEGSKEALGGGNAESEKKKRLPDKLQKERTEPKWGYAIYVQEQKVKAGKSKLDMRKVNSNWKTMNDIEKEHYRGLSRIDKLSLGEKYRKRGKKDVKKKTKGQKKVKNSVVLKDVDSLKDVKKKEPTVTSLLEDLNELDIEFGHKLSVKDEQYQNLLKLRIEAEVIARELGEIDGTIMSYKRKCEALKKKKMEG